MDSESDGGYHVDDSDESILDFNDDEFDLPATVPPSLESILWDDAESFCGGGSSSDNVSEHSLQSTGGAAAAASVRCFKSMLYHSVLQGITAQVRSAGERVQAGTPTVIANSLHLVAVGTSHGYIFAFDAEQKLRWCCSDDGARADQGSLSALAFNTLATRLIAGFERGLIVMIDANTGDIIRRMADAHAPQSAVLLLRFTVLPTLAMVSDSAGCVFSLAFTKRLGMRTWKSKCLFSGARGEVCTFEPMMLGTELLGNDIIIAMATLSKVIVITIKPKLRVLYSTQLPRCSTSLPLLAWQLVMVGKSWQPVLCWGRGSELNYLRLVVGGASKRSRLQLVPLRNVRLPYTLCALHWVGARHLALLDTSERLRLVDVRTQQELETVDVTSAGLVYASAHFKALALGGGVSGAFALAGERACYNSLSSRGDQLLVLGTRAVHLVKVRTWHERLVFLSKQGRWTEALQIAAEAAPALLASAAACGGKDGEIVQNGNRHIERVDCSSTLAGAENLLNRFMDHLATQSGMVDWSALSAAVNCCIKLQKTNLLCDQLWDAITADPQNQDWYLSLLANYVAQGALTTLTPAITQALVAHLDDTDRTQLSTVLLQLDLCCLDLDQVLRICRHRRFYDAWIHITTKTIGDYASPLLEFLDELTVDNHELGNTLLVYVSACLAGYGYPHGAIAPAHRTQVKYDILRCLETLHSVKAPADEPSYPYLRALLAYNTRECLNVVKLAFTEPEFAGEMGLLHRLRLVEILLAIVQPPQFNDGQVTVLACFISRLSTSNNLQLTQAMLDAVVKALTSVAGKQLSVRDHSEREQAWLDLLTADKLMHIPRGQLLTVAIESRCFKVAEYLYELDGNYEQIVGCYLNTHSDDVFGYLRQHVYTFQRCIDTQFRRHFRQLLHRDARATVEFLLEHFSADLDTFTASVKGDDEAQYLFLHNLIKTHERISQECAEEYLELLCKRGEPGVDTFVKMQLCDTDRALLITRKYNSSAAEAVLLEYNGDFKAALELLLSSNSLMEAQALCVRGTEQLDTATTQALWLMLLEHCRQRSANPNGVNVTLRELVHNAAPHIGAHQLLELVGDAGASIGDLKQTLSGVFADYRHDIAMLQATARLLDIDLHNSLANNLHNDGRGISVVRLTCTLCQQSLDCRHSADDDDYVTLYGCGHMFHSKCLTQPPTSASPALLSHTAEVVYSNDERQPGDISCCVQCNKKTTLVNTSKAFVPPLPVAGTRPDLEGIF